MRGSRISDDLRARCERGDPSLRAQGPGSAAHTEARPRACAEAFLRHQIPDGDLEKVLGKAVDELLATLMRKKFAATKNPRPQAAPSEKRTRYTQAATKRALA